MNNHRHNKHLQTKSQSDLESHEESLEFFIGQFPHPDTMNKYSEDVKTTILDMAKKEQDNEFNIKNQEIKLLELSSNKNAKLEKRGQIFGFLLALSVLSAVVFLAYTGKTGAWITTLVVGFISIIAVFSKNNTNSNTDKNKNKNKNNHDNTTK